MQQLADGIILEWGKPTQTILDMVRGVYSTEIRESDLEELYDMLRGIGWSMDSIMNMPFGVLLNCGLGMNREDCIYYALIDEYEHRPLFIATLSRVGLGENSGVCLMNGFGLTVGYERVTRREILHTINTLFTKLISDLSIKFNATLAVCHVKATNAETLLMWRYLEKRYRGTGVKITITDDPFIKRRAYKLVTLTVGGTQDVL